MSTNKPELDSAHLVAVTRPLPPQPRVIRIERESRPEQSAVARPLAFLNDVEIDGRETSYFEWLGAGIYCSGLRAATRDGPPQVLRELHYGFSERLFYLRVDAFPGSWSKLRDFEVHVSIRGSQELRLLVGIEARRFAGWILDTDDLCILGPHQLVEVAFDEILELSIARRLFQFAAQTSLMVNVTLWQAGIPVDSLPPDGSLEVQLGTDAFAWPAE